MGPPVSLQPSCYGWDRKIVYNIVTGKLDSNCGDRLCFLQKCLSLRKGESWWPSHWHRVFTLIERQPAGPLGVKDQTTYCEPCWAVCTTLCVRKCGGRKLLIMQLIEQVRLLPSLFSQAGWWKCWWCNVLTQIHYLLPADCTSWSGLCRSTSIPPPLL